MSLRRKVAELLTAGRLDDIAALSDESKNVVSAVMSRLYEADALARFRAADALGRTAARMLERDRRAIDELLRKLAWSLNEESGATAWGAPHAIGEVSRCDPDMAEMYYPLLVSYLHHDDVYLETDILVHGVLHALGRVAEAHPRVGPKAVEPLIGLLQSSDDENTRGLAAWALGKIGDSRARESLLGLIGDRTLFEQYVDGQMRKTELGLVARAAIESLAG